MNIYEKEQYTWVYDGKRYLLKVEHDDKPKDPRVTKPHKTIMACWQPGMQLGDILEDKTSKDFWQRLAKEYVSCVDMVNTAKQGKLTGVHFLPNPKDKTKSDVYYSYDGKPDGPLYEAVPEERLLSFILQDLRMKDCMILLQPFIEVQELYTYVDDTVTMYTGDMVKGFTDAADFDCVGWAIAFKGDYLNSMEWGEDECPDEYSWRNAAQEQIEAEVQDYRNYLLGKTCFYRLYSSDEGSELDTSKTTGWKSERSNGDFYGYDMEENGLVNDVGHGFSAALHSGAVECCTKHTSLPTSRLVQEDKDLLLSWGHTLEDLEQIEDAMKPENTFYEHEGKRISRKKAIELLGRKEYLSGLSRSAFHWTCSRISDDGKSVDFDSSAMFRDDD